MRRLDNGSFRAIEGITSPDGRVLGKMAHILNKTKKNCPTLFGQFFCASKRKFNC
jgi:phosphoribosylformylglycinamidine synthase